jgi:phage terminase large subunit-like protein
MEARAAMIEEIEILEEMARRKKQNALRDTYRMLYSWQFKFVEATETYHESCLCAANQIGKSMTGRVMDACHLTGDYPDDYPGHKFEHPPLCWCLGYSMEKTRDLLQNHLFGKFRPGEGFEGGLVPKDRIVSWESAIGTPNAMRTVRVKHVTGGTSVMQFWSYSQGQHAIMGDIVDWVHVDEEPRDQTIRPQLITRTANGDKGRGGRVIYTLTPENGRTELIIKFMDDPSASQFFMMKGWDDAPHMTPEKRERLLESYPDHQRDMRSKGIPMLGHGRIYDLADEFVLCDPFPLPIFWKVIVGMDFGWDHPQAFAKLAIDPDNDIVYVVNSWRKPKVSANDAWGAVSSWARSVPVAWPSDGLIHEKGRDVTSQQKDHYHSAGFSMLHSHANWPDGSNSVEHGIYELLDRMRKGTLRIFRGQQDLMEELRQYHRDEKQRIVKVMDDVLDAVRYAYMMRRYAKVIAEVGVVPTIRKPQPIKPMGKRR